MSAAITTFGEKPKPSHTTNSGATAIFGITCARTSNGYTERSSGSEIAITTGVPQRRVISLGKGEPG